MEMERGGRIFGTGGRSEKLEVQTVIEGHNLPSPSSLLLVIELNYLPHIGVTNSKIPANPVPPAL